MNVQVEVLAVDIRSATLLGDFREMMMGMLPGTLSFVSSSRKGARALKACRIGVLIWTTSLGLGRSQVTVSGQRSPMIHVL